MVGQGRSSTHAGPRPHGSVLVASYRSHLFAVLVAASLLSGCTDGGPTDDGPGATAGATSPPTVEPTAAPGPSQSPSSPSPSANRLCDTEVTSANPVLRNVRFGRHDTFDRLAFDFCKPAETTLTRRPWSSSSPRTGPATKSASTGRSFFLLTLTPADAHSDTGDPTVPNEAVTVTGNYVQQYKLIGDFEGVVSYGVGVSRLAETATAIQSDPGDPRHIVLYFDLGPQTG